MTTAEDLYSWQNPTKPTPRGAFIVIEGLDRSGKSTQVQRLCDKLYSQGHNIRTLSFPDRTSPIGKMINSYLQSGVEMDDHVIHLLFSANRWEKAKWIEDTLKSGYTIVCDRYYYSGMIYSAAKNNPTLDLKWARAPEIGLPRPDVVVFLDLKPEDAEKRGGYGEEKYEKRGMQTRVRTLYWSLLERGGEEAQMKVVNAGESIELVGDLLLAEVAEALERVAGGEELARVTLP